MRSFGLVALAALATRAAAYRVPISDDDDYREICSGMYGGDDAFIEVEFDASSTGQVALVIYEWKDIGYLGAEQKEDDPSPRQYICTSKAVSAGQCTAKQLGGFITTLPTFVESTIYTTPLRFGGSSSVDARDDSLDSLRRRGLWIDRDMLPNIRLGRAAAEENTQGTTHKLPGHKLPQHGSTEGHKVEAFNGEAAHTDSKPDTSKPDASLDDSEAEYESAVEEEPHTESFNGDAAHVEAPHGGEVDENPVMDDPEASVSAAAAAAAETEDTAGGTTGTDPKKAKPKPASEPDTSEKPDTVEEETEPVKPPPATGSWQLEGDVKNYDGPIHYKVPNTGYYCVGVVPVTLVKGDKAKQNERRELTERGELEERAVDEHGSYRGVVTFRNQFRGELPAAEYPKIAFYGFLSAVYFLLACGWGYLCWKHRAELLPMQLYISGTIAFLVLEQLALWGYYRYVNKHGGGAGSLAFLIVTAILNAGRTTLSFFLLLVVSMGLSVVTPSLGSVMQRIWILTGLHFVFGVAYSVGTVKIALDTAAIWVVLLLIFPLSVTLTAFLMWIIVSLNGTIQFLRERKQYHKLSMFERLWRILIGAVIAVATFFVLSSISLSGRMDDDYQPSHWKWRWVLLDASLAMIYLVTFAMIAWLWRPTENNVRFSTSQELAQDEDDAHDFEIETYERRPEALGLQSMASEQQHVHGDSENPAEHGYAQPGELRAKDEYAHEASEGKALFDAGDSDSDSDSDDGKGKAKERDEDRPPAYRKVDAKGRPVPVTVNVGPASRARVQEDSQIFAMGDDSDDEVRSAVSIDLSEDEGLLKSKRD